MRTHRVSLIYFLLASIVSFGSCSDGRSPWKGTIKIVDGVTVVDNPLEPMFGVDVFCIEEEMSIGVSEGREEYMFSEVPSLAADVQGRIYVLDYKAAHIRVFSRDGKHIRTIGTKGRGPGEIRRASLITITAQNDLVVLDRGNLRISYFTLQGKFIRSFSTVGRNLLQFNIDSEGGFYGLCYFLSDENRRYELIAFDESWNTLRVFASSPWPNSRRDGYNPFFPILRWSLIKGSGIVYGNMRDYELHIHESSGSRIISIKKTYRPVRVTRRDIEERFEGEEPPPELKQNMVVPKYHCPFQRMTTDGEGRIFVMTYERVENGGGYYYDVFDSEGRCVAKIPLKTPPILWKEGKLYTVEEDEEGFQYIKRYGVTWQM